MFLISWLVFLSVHIQNTRLKVLSHSICALLLAAKCFDAAGKINVIWGWLVMTVVWCSIAEEYFCWESVCEYNLLLDITLLLDSLLVLWYILALLQSSVEMNAGLGSQFSSVAKSGTLNCMLSESVFINPLTPNDPYRGRTATLTSKVAFYIFIQQI